MPAGCFGLRTGALFSKCGRARKFWIETWIDLCERMNDRLRPIMPNDADGRNSARGVFVNKLLGRLLQPLSVKEKSAEGKRSA